MALSFHFEDVTEPSFSKIKVKKALADLIQGENRIHGDIAVVFCSDDYLLGINNTYLNHDYYTDIITFNYNESEVVSGDLFISVDRVAENAGQLGIPFETELYRVIGHGVLHLLGYADDTEQNIAQIRSKEEEFISLIAGL